MFKIPRNIRYVIDTLTQNGYEAYIVGGCVRDILLGKTPDDFDITTSAKPEEIMSLFKKTIPTGIKHGTITVMIEGCPIEVTTFRRESGYTDTRHPDKVEFVNNLKEDLSRRDFTVNAMAYSDKTGIIDYFGGEIDLKNKILRTVGNPHDRFTEDALRILRLFRFASTLGFSVEDQSLKASLDCANLLKNISRERIFVELKKSVVGDNLKAFKPLIKSGGLSFLKICETPDFEKIKKHKSSPLLCLYLFLKTDALNELKPSNKEKEYFDTLDKFSSFKPPKTKADFKEMLNIGNFEILSDYLTLCEIDNAPLKEIIKKGEPYSIKHLDITGNDLKNLGFSGEKIGEILELLRKFVIENPQKNTKENLLNQIP